MFLWQIKSEGIDHLSYMIGSDNSAAVIDPSRDIDVYIDIAREESVNISHIFETHRNEDYVIGSIPLSEKTGADIYRGKELVYAYGNPVADGDEFEVGTLKLRILETPIHTFESISIAAYYSPFCENAIGVFTGAPLFAGDVGRTDFLQDQDEKAAGLLYDSMFNKILPLGDQTILYPTHGAGSICDSGITLRELLTLAYERLHNPLLQKTDRDEFIQYKVKEKRNKPSYFKMVEQ